jgi:hypothetical protein
MKFAVKYEILEPVTRGSVETFMARIIATDEPVLVHIFECPEQRPDQPTVQWVLESFRAVAPDPPELVLGTGRYSGTSYAYLATKLPDRAVLQEWVRSYEAQEETRGSTFSPQGTAAPDLSHESKDNLPHDISGTDQPTVILGFNQPEETTTMLEASRSNANTPSEASVTPTARQTESSGPGVTVIDFSGSDFRPSEKVEPAEPGEFTRQFARFENAPEEPAQAVSSGTPVPEEPPLSAAPTDEVLGVVAGDRTPAGMGPPKETPSDSSQSSAPISASPVDAPSITGLFSFGDASQLKDSLDTASGTEDDIKTGEFTGFFQGPFDGERSSQTPDPSPAVSQPRKQPGEFTKIFGKSEDGHSRGTIASQSRVRETPVEDDPGVRTPRFENADARPKIPETYEPIPQHTEIIEANSREILPSVEQPMLRAPVLPKTPIDSPAQTPVPEFSSGQSWRDAGTEFMSRPGAEGATQVFSRPGRDSLPGSTTTPAAPSDFTRIISGGLREPTPAEEPLMPTGSHDDFVEKLAPPPGISWPHSSLPAAPPAPQFQQPGHYPQTPAPPGASAPPLPLASQLGSAAPKPAGLPSTLIIIMSGLLIIAVLLVLYFALKH